MKQARIRAGIDMELEVTVDMSVDSRAQAQNRPTMLIMVVPMRHKRSFMSKRRWTILMNVAIRCNYGDCLFVSVGGCR